MNKKDKAEYQRLSDESDRILEEMDNIRQRCDHEYCIKREVSIEENGEQHISNLHTCADCGRRWLVA